MDARRKRKRKGNDEGEASSGDLSHQEFLRNCIYCVFVE